MRVKENSFFIKAEYEDPDLTDDIAVRRSILNIPLGVTLLLILIAEFTPVPPFVGQLGIFAFILTLIFLLYEERIARALDMVPESGNDD